MRCPFCAYPEDRVVDSRIVSDGRVIRRRRQCESCGRRYTTREKIEESALVIVKKDGRREAYNRGKLLGGLIRASEKRPIPMNTIKEFADQLESRLLERGSPEIPSAEIGEQVSEFLKGLDPIAYIRFASVYRSFTELHEFIEEIEEITRRKS